MFSAPTFVEFLLCCCFTFIVERPLLKTISKSHIVVCSVSYSRFFMLHFLPCVKGQ